jgi:hypothetical protein
VHPTPVTNSEGPASYPQPTPTPASRPFPAPELPAAGASGSRSGQCTSCGTRVLCTTAERHASRTRKWATRTLKRGDPHGRDGRLARAAGRLPVADDGLPHPDAERLASGARNGRLARWKGATRAVRTGDSRGQPGYRGTASGAPPRT